MLRQLLLATTASFAVAATPAIARDNSGYIGIDLGVLIPQHQSGVFRSTFTQSAQSPAAGTTAPAPGTGLVGALPALLAAPPAAVSGGARIKWKEGYDFGMFRLEGELGYKRSKLKHFTQDTAFGAAVGAALNPAGTTGTTFTFPLNTASAFDL